jgi:hypothetical protein
MLQELEIAKQIANASERSTALNKLARGLIGSGDQGYDSANVEPEFRKAQLETIKAGDEKAYQERLISLEEYISKKHAAIEFEYNIDLQKAKGNQTAELVAMQGHKKALIEWEKWGNDERKKLQDEQFKYSMDRRSVLMQWSENYIQQIQSDKLLTQQQKNSQMLRLLENRLTDIKSMSEAYNARSQDQTLAPNERLEAESRYLEISQQRLEVAQRIQEIEGDTSVIYQTRSALIDLMNQWGTLAQQIATTIAGTINTAIDSVSVNLTEVIKGTKTWNQALYAIADTILTTIIQSIIKMAMQWMISQVLMAAVGKSIGAAAQAASVGMAFGTAASLSAIFAAPAILATVATDGQAAMSAPGWVAESLAWTPAIAALAAYERGGRFAGGTPILVGENGPEIMVPAGPGLVIPNDISAKLSGGSGPVNVLLFDDRSKLRSYMETSEGRAQVVDIVRGSKHMI